MSDSERDLKKQMGITDKNDRNPYRTLMTPEIKPVQTKDGAFRIKVKGGTIFKLCSLLSHNDKELLLMLHNHFGHKGYTMVNVPYLKRTETNMLLTMYHDELAFSTQQKCDIKRIAYILKFGKRPSGKVLADIYGDVQKDRSFIT